MYIRRATESEILAVLCHPTIYSSITEDGAPPPEDWRPEDPTALFLAGFTEMQELIGIFILHREGAILWQCHIQVLPQYRKDYALGFGKFCLNWFFTVYKATLKAEIPSIYPNVIDFAKKQGFIEVGKIPKAHKKNGEKHDLIILAMEDGQKLKVN